MKKFLSVLSVLALLIGSCQKGPGTVSVIGVALNLQTISLTEGESAVLTATVFPSDATNRSVRWSSTDASVASVENGKVTAHKAGNATVKVITEDGGKTASCQVTVNPKVVNVESVSLDRTELSLA